MTRRLSQVEVWSCLCLTLLTLGPARGEDPSVAPPAARGKGVYLRDTRRIPGTIIRQAGGYVVIDSAFGQLTFPAWMIDTTGEVRELWRFMSRLDAPTPQLLEELRKRHEMPDEERRAEEIRKSEDLKAERLELARLLVVRDSKALEAFADSFLAEHGRDHAGLNEEALGIAQKALAAAAKHAARESTPEAALKAARLYSRLYCLNFTGNSRLGWDETKECVLQFFHRDPLQWGPGLSIVNRLEAYGWLGDVGDLSTVAWRWRTGNWLPPGDLDEEFLVVRTGDTGRVLPKRPSTREGIASVWRPAVKEGPILGVLQGQVIRKREDAWQRIFWCPVAKTWKENTVPEQLIRSSLVLSDYLNRHIHQERSDVRRVSLLLADYNRALDRLARDSFNPENGTLKPGWDQGFSRANRAFDALLTQNNVSLRRRAYIQPALERLHEVEALLEQARQGKAVDLSRIRPPEPVTAGDDGLDRFVAILEGFDVELRLRTLRENAIDKYRGTRQVWGAVKKLSEDEFALADEREAAANTLRRWRAATDGSAAGTAKATAAESATDAVPAK